MGTKDQQNDPSHMTKMVATPIYGKIVKKPQEPEGQKAFDLVYSIRYLGSTKSVQMTILV